MGRLATGKLLDWKETKKYSLFVRRHAAEQFLKLHQKHKDKKGDKFQWGDEIEFSLLTLDASEVRAQLSLLGPTILPLLQEPEIHHPKDHLTKWTPEQARYMIEGTPGAQPYGDIFTEVHKVEENMKLRRQQLYDVLDGLSPHTFPLTISVFPRQGCPKFTSPEYVPNPDKSVLKSVFYPDEVVVQKEEQPRYLTLSDHIFQRRGHPIAINIPIFRDRCTPMPFKENFPLAQTDHIYMDCDGFGSGSCCLQVTFQASCLEEACYLYDQLAVMAPLMLALTAASPIFRGYIADVDCRWAIIVDSNDDRTLGEMGLQPPQEGERFIPFSRWDSIEAYLFNRKCNDINVPYDPDIYKLLKDGGINDLLAQHLAYLFMKDPLVLFAEDVTNETGSDTHHCDNLLSSVWQTVRLKPPHSNAGWRVEFRPMELHLTDHENAAFAVFMMLLARTIISKKLNLCIPISKLNENMKTAPVRGAVCTGNFYMPNRNIIDDGTVYGGGCPQDFDAKLMNMDTIFNGKGEFAGLIPVMRKYMEETVIDAGTKRYLEDVLTFISMKASGELMTTATWIRGFVTSHSEYKNDSCISDRITHDLISTMKQITEGVQSCSELTGTLTQMKI